MYSMHQGGNLLPTRDWWGRTYSAMCSGLSLIHFLLPHSASIYQASIVYEALCLVLGKKEGQGMSPALKEYSLCTNNNVVSDQLSWHSSIQECSLPRPFTQSTKESPIISNPGSPLSALLPGSRKGGSIHVLEG